MIVYIQTYQLLLIVKNPIVTIVHDYTRYIVHHSFPNLPCSNAPAQLFISLLYRMLCKTLSPLEAKLLTNHFSMNDIYLHVTELKALKKNKSSIHLYVIEF